MGNQVQSHTSPVLSGRSFGIKVDVVKEWIHDGPEIQMGKSEE